MSDELPTATRVSDPGIRATFRSKPPPGRGGVKVGTKRPLRAARLWRRAVSVA